MASTSRDPWLDNAKLWLVVVVVIGHSVVLMPPTDERSQLYDFIYQFHIPAFVLVTGYLSRTFQWSRRHLTALVYSLLVPYLIFELALALFRVHVTGEVSSLEVLSPLWLEPHWPMWYLIVLIMWRLATPILRSHWLMVPASIAVSLGAGFFDLQLFDLNRALGLLPFFVVGLHLGPRLLDRLRSPWSYLPGAAVMVWLWTLAAQTDDHWSTQWFYYRSSYTDLGVDGAEGISTRATLIAIGLLGSFAALCVIPRAQHWFTAMGAWTMGVYLLHGFVVRGLEWRGYADWMPEDPWAAAWLTIAFGTALALVLAWPPLASRLAWVVDPLTTATRRRRSTS